LRRCLEEAFIAGELNFFSAHRHLHEPAAFRRYLAPAWNADYRRDETIMLEVMRAHSTLSVVLPAFFQGGMSL
jgi:hypothetical protein